MGADKQRLSKRHGATSVMEYEKQGYLPEAMVNFLALLGWGTGSNDELFTKDELIQRFNLEGISGGNAVFNTEKLDWFNHQHLLRLTDDELIARIEGLLAHRALAKVGLEAWGLRLDPAWTLEGARAVAAALQEVDGLSRPAAPFLRRSHRVRSGRREEAPFRARDGGSSEGLAGRVCGGTRLDEVALEKRLRELAEARGVKAGALIHGTRLAMTGRMVSPGLFEMLVLLGRERVVDEARGELVSMLTT